MYMTKFKLHSIHFYLATAVLIVCIVIIQSYVKSKYSSYRHDGWRTVFEKALPEESVLLIVVDEKPETWNRVVAWEWWRHGKCVDNGYLGVVEALYDVDKISPETLQITEQRWMVYDSDLKVILGVFQAEAQRVQLVDRKDVDEVELLSKAQSISFVDDLRWIPR